MYAIENSTLYAMNEKRKHSPIKIGYIGLNFYFYLFFYHRRLNLALVN